MVLLTTCGAPISSTKSTFSTPVTCAAKLNSSTLHLLGIMTASPSLPFLPRLWPPLELMIDGIWSGSCRMFLAIVPSTLYPVITTPFRWSGAHLSSNVRLMPDCNIPGDASMTHPPMSSKRSRLRKLRMNLKSHGPALTPFAFPLASASAILARKMRLMLSFIALIYVWYITMHFLAVWPV